MQPRALPPGIIPYAGPSGILLTPERHDGIRRLLFLAGAAITPKDITNIVGRDKRIDFERFCELAITLSKQPEVVRRPLDDLLLDTQMFVFECPDGGLRVFVPGRDGALTCLDADTGLETTPPQVTTVGRAAMLSPESPAGQERRPPLLVWLMRILEGSGNASSMVIFLTFLSNVFGLALPLFTLAVYDQVLAADNPSMLVILIIGLILSIASDVVVRLLRSVMTARSTSLIDLSTTTTLFNRLMRTSMFALVGVNSRIGFMRLRDVEMVRTFFTGPIGIACIEAPFSLIYLFVLAWLGGWIAVAVAAVLLVGGGLLFAMMGPAVRRTRSLMRQSEQYGATCSEIADRFPRIKAEGRAHSWLIRYREASAKLAEAERVKMKSILGTQAIVSGLVSVAVLAAIFAGSLLAINGELSVGALIASVALVWRMTAPLPTLFIARLRWFEIRDAIQSATGVLELPSGTASDTGLGGRGRGMAGHIAFSSVMMSYQQGHAAAIRNVSFEIKPGEVVALIGHSGAGKSTMLDLMAGMLEPQFGTITIDGINPRQISPSVLRQSLGYLPRDHGTLPFTIDAFLNLEVEEELRGQRLVICERLGILQQIEKLPNGIYTSMSELDPHSGLVRAMALARVLATDASLLLLDEPDASSVTARKSVLTAIEERRGASTIVLATHEPEFVSCADRVLVLNQGAIVRNCTPSDIVRQKEVASK